MALEVGSVFARAGAKFDDDGFDRFDRRLRKARTDADKGAKADLRADVDERGFHRYNDQLDKSERNTRKAEASSHRLGGAFGTVGAAAGGAALAGVAALGYGVVKATQGWQEHLAVVHQTEAVFKSTGGAAGISVKGVNDLSNALEKKTTIDNDVIQSGANMLLTFTNVRNETGKGNDIFNQATATLTDMSVALGTDTKQSAIQLGKALNDPIKGVTALQRVGVTFTGQQKDQIKTLVDSGHKMEAQKLILRELNKEFGGSAEKQATPLKRLMVLFRDAGDAVGKFLAPAIDGAAKALTTFGNGIENGTGAGGKFVTVVKAIGSAVGNVGKGIITFGRNMVDAFSGGDKDATELGGNIAKTFRAIISAAKDVGASIKRTFSGVGPELAIIGRALAKVANLFVTVFRAQLGPVKKILEGMAQVIRGVIQVIAGVLTLNFGKAWQGVKNIFGGGIKAALGQLGLMLAPARALAGKIGGVIKSAFTGAFNGIKSVMRSFLGAYLGMVSGVLNGIEKMVRVASHLPLIGGQFKGLANKIADARHDIDKYRDSLKDVDKQAGKTSGIRSLRDQVTTLGVKLNGLRRGTATYRDTAEALRKKQRQLNDALAATKPAARTASKGLQTLGNTFAGVGSAQEGVVRYTDDQVNKALRDFGAKPTAHKAKGWTLGQRQNVFTGGDLHTGGVVGYAGGGMLPVRVSSGEETIGPDGWRSTVPGPRVGYDNVLTALEHGTAVITDQGKALRQAGLGMGSILRRQSSHISAFAGGGMVRIPGDPDTTGGRDKVNAAIVDDVADMVRRFGVQVNYAFDPGGGHHSPGHNVTGTATDVGPWKTGWDGVDRAAAASVKAGHTTYYDGRFGTTPLAGHGRPGYGSTGGNHLHIEWGGGGVLGAGGAGFNGIKALKIEGGTGVTRGFLQGTADKLRKAANSYVQSKMPAGSPDSGGGFGNVPTFGGGHLSRPQVRELLKATRMPDIMGWVAGAESGWDPHQENSIGASGLWQILRSAHPDLLRKYGDPLDAGNNAKMASSLYHDEGLGPWADSKFKGGLGGNGGWAQMLGQPFGAGGVIGGLAAVVPGFKGGGVVGGTGLLTTKGKKSTSAWRHVVGRAEKYIESEGHVYDQTNRRFDLTEEDFVNEGDENTPPSLNQPAIAHRLKELNALIAIRKKIVARYKKMLTYLAKLIKTYRVARTRLTATVAAARNSVKAAGKGKGKDAKKKQEAAQARLEKYSKALTGVRSTIADLGEKQRNAGFDLEDSSVDLLELQKERGPLLNQGKGGNVAGIGVIAGVELPDFTPPTPETPDTGDTGDSDTSDTDTTTADPAAVAAAAAAQFTSFQASRADLFGNFGSNFQTRGGPGLGNVPGGPGGDAVLGAGTRNFGVLGAGDGGLGIGARAGVNIVNNFAAPPPDAITWTEQQRFAAQASLG